MGINVNVSFLGVILYYDLAGCYHWGKLSKAYLSLSGLCQIYAPESTNISKNFN